MPRADSRSNKLKKPPASRSRPRPNKTALKATVTLSTPTAGPSNSNLPSISVPIIKNLSAAPVLQAPLPANRVLDPLLKQEFIKMRAEKLMAMQSLVDWGRAIDICDGCSKHIASVEDGDTCPGCYYRAYLSCLFDVFYGTCYCPNSNFEAHYCCMKPGWHFSKRTLTPYAGDRHPTPVSAESRFYSNRSEIYEGKRRPCNTCGKIARCLINLNKVEEGSDRDAEGEVYEE